MKEIYKEIPWLTGRYKVSNYGNIKSFKKGRWKNLKIQTSPKGYKKIVLDKNYLVHRLVVSTFIGEIPPKYEVNHMDCNPSNNYIGNLEICTSKENSQHALRNGRYNFRETKGDKNGNSKLTTSDVKHIKNMFKDGVTPYKIHDKFPHVGRTSIYNILEGFSWKHVK